MPGLQALHRFAVTFHRQQRGERMKRSRLSDIPGVGPKRVKDLLAHFHSIDAIQLASVERLTEAPGVGQSMARQIHDFFHPDDDPSSELQDSEDSFTRPEQKLTSLEAS